MQKTQIRDFTKGAITGPLLVFAWPLFPFLLQMFSVFTEDPQVLEIGASYVPIAVLRSTARRCGQ